MSKWNSGVCINIYISGNRKLVMVQIDLDAKSIENSFPIRYYVFVSCGE